MKKITLILVLLLLAQATACGGSTTATDTTASSGADTASAEESTYLFTQEYAGDTIRVLNIDNIFSMHCVIDTKETNGETLNDTMYNAVRRIEDEMGITWKEDNIDLQKDFPTIVPRLILSGDDQYEIIYENTRDLYTYSEQGYYYNLLDYNAIQLNEDWWLSDYNDYNMVGGKLYTAMGYSHLAVIDAISCLWFNQSMMVDLGLDLPYDAVRDGKWTLDMLRTYIKSAANLNGEDAFAWKDEGSCIWGISMPSNTGTNWTRPLGEQIVDISGDGKLTITAGKERFYDACDKVASILGATDGSVYMGHFNGDDKPGSYINCFEVQRSLFGCSEVCKANRMRNLDFDFGVLPYPKYDEAQERYYSSVSYPASGVSIPVTCTDPARSAVVGDAINYIFYEDVWPTFRTVTLESKNLRNDNSIEMLQIVLNSIYPNICHIYGVGTSLNDVLSASMRSGDAQAASKLAAYRQQIEDDIKALNER